MLASNNTQPLLGSRLQRFAPRLVNPTGSNLCWLNSIMQQLFANPRMRAIFGNMELPNSSSNSASINSKSDDPRLPILVVSAFAAAIDSMQRNVDDANAINNPLDSPLALSFASFVQTFWVEDSTRGVAPLFIRRRQHDVTEFFSILLSSLDAAFPSNHKFIKTQYGVCVQGSRRCKVCGDCTTFESVPVRTVTVFYNTLMLLLLVEATYALGADQTYH